MRYQSCRRCGQTVLRPGCTRSTTWRIQAARYLGFQAIMVPDDWDEPEL
jgi:hypothetical protein